jgi:hypothetical protein
MTFFGKLAKIFMYFALPKPGYCTHYIRRALLKVQISFDAL